MAAEWVRLCHGAPDLRATGDDVDVTFTEGRRHRLSVQDNGDSYAVTGLVAKPAAASRVEDLSMQIWRRNRATPLVGFRIDGRGRVLGQAFIPKAGLSSEEFQQWLRVVAAECDRLELVLTGRDLE